MRTGFTYSSLALAGMLFAGAYAPAAMAQSGDTQDIPLVPFSDTTTWSRYATGGECEWDQQWSENVFWRDKRPDTVFHTKEGNANQSGTQSNINSCATRYSPSNSAERELLGVAQAALSSNQMDKADAALARLTKLVSTQAVFPKSWAYYEAADVYIGAPQPQLKKAEGFIAKLDAMGASAAIERMLAHSDLAGEAQREDSIDLWDKQLQAALAASKQITGDMQKQFAMESADVYTSIAQLRERKGDIAGARAILTAGRTELVPLRPRTVQSFNYADTWLAMQGQNPGPLKNTAYANAASGATYPTSGKPAVIAFVSANCGSFCYDDYGVLRRMLDHYTKDQVDFVLVTHTEGYSRGQLVKPDSEMKIISDYWLNFMKFPAVISLWQGVYHQRSDGRQMLQTPPIEEAYRPPVDMMGHITVGVVDKSGVIRMYTTLWNHNEIMLNDVLKSVM